MYDTFESWGMLQEHAVVFFTTSTEWQTICMPCGVHDYHFESMSPRAAAKSRVLSEVNPKVPLVARSGMVNYNCECRCSSKHA